MYLTFPVYVTLNAPSVEEGRRWLKGMLDSEKILKISYTISPPIFSPDRPSVPTPTTRERETLEKED